MKCQTFLMACKTENNETLSSLTTPPPVECPTPPPTMNTTPIQCQYSTQPPNMETMLVQCTTIPPTGSMNNNTAPNEGSCGSVVLGLIFSVIILIAILLLALVGWIVTCVRSQIRIYK